MQRVAWAAQIAVLIVAGRATEVYAGAGQVVRQVTITATLRSHASVRVSSPVLTFVVDESGVASGSIEYAAAARVGSGEVLLSVECGEVTGPAADADKATILVGEDERNAVAIQPAALMAIARWTGGGTRAGRLRFHLRAYPGTYVVPLRMSLATP